MTPPPPPGWPAGRPLAICVNVMLEGWVEGSAPGIGPMVQDQAAFCSRAY